MKIRYVIWLLASVLSLALLAGCGGGSGGGSSSTPVPAGTTKITGTASKGIIYPGTVNVYAVGANGTKGALLAGPVSTDIDGKYSAPLNGYSGAVVVEVSGTYTDEATGKSVTIDPSKPLHALVDNVNETNANNRVVAVTPLTEVAWRKASSNGTQPVTPTAIANANKLVGDLFKVGDILGTEPVRPDTATMANSSKGAQAYTLALASLSQMATTASGASDSDKLESVISRMEVEVETAETSGSMSSTATGDFTTAMGAVALGDDFPSAKDQLSKVGRKSQFITLSISGTLPAATSIYAINGSIALPATISLRSEDDGKASLESFVLTGIAKSLAAGDPIANYQGPQQQVDFSIQFDPSKAGIGSGDFAIMAYDVVAGATVTAADFSMVAGSFTAKDSNGANISGMSVTIK